MSATPEIRTLADLVQRLGGVPLERIRFQPAPGTATVQDVLTVKQQEGQRCELVAGVLVEKTPGNSESALTARLLSLLGDFLRLRNLGNLSGPDDAFELLPELVRAPDLAFTSWERLPGGRPPAAPLPRLVPNLVIEVLSRSNTTGELALKRQDYFAAGVEMLWEINPAARAIANLDFGAGASTMLRPGDVLLGGTVLPDFALPVAELFAEPERQGQNR